MLTFLCDSARRLMPSRADGAEFVMRQMPCEGRHDPGAMAAYRGKDISAMNDRLASSQFASGFDPKPTATEPAAESTAKPTLSAAPNIR